MTPDPLEERTAVPGEPLPTLPDAAYPTDAQPLEPSSAAGYLRRELHR